MRLRLMIAMLVVVGITIASVVGFAMVSTVREVNVYMFRGGMYGLNELVTQLEDYYKQNGNWADAKKLFNDSHGMMANPENGMGMMGGKNVPIAPTPIANNPPSDTPMDMVPQTSHLILTDAKGNTLTRFRGKEDISKLTDAQMDQAIPLRTDDNTIVGYLYTDESAPIQPGGERPLTAKLYSSVQKAALIGIAIAILLSLFLGYWFLKPIQLLTKAASALGKGDLNQRVAIHGTDELAQLGKSFNNMAESLQRAEDSRKAMTADIAHELRTPLSVQRATVEAMIDGVYPMDENSLRPVMEQNVLLTRLVDDLRTLAMADSGEIRLEKVEIDISRLSQNVFNRFQTQADRQEVSLLFQASPSIPSIQADPIRLEQILTNLVGNALRFTPGKGIVSLTVAYTGKSIEIRIKDTGPGIPPESLPYIFDRFYRADKARNREEGGSGLGLAIARQLARAHSGDINACNAESGGAEFCLTLPA